MEPFRVLRDTRRSKKEWEKLIATHAACGDDRKNKQTTTTKKKPKNYKNNKHQIRQNKK